MYEYPLPQAAARSGMDERSFRLLADRRVIFATPRTRTQGRGKQKLYSTDEILIAAVLAPLVRTGADSFSLAGAADYLRKQIGSREFHAARRGEPVYVRLRYREADDWGIEINEARRIFRTEDPAKPSDYFIPVTEPGPTNEDWSPDFIAVKLDNCIRRVEEDVLHTWRSHGLTPSESLALLEQEQIVIHTPEQIEAMKTLLKHLIEAGDQWKEVAA